MVSAGTLTVVVDCSVAAAVKNVILEGVAEWDWSDLACLKRARKRVDPSRQ